LLVRLDMARLSFARCALIAVAMTLVVCACGSSEPAKGTVTLSWTEPTTNTDGSPIGAITGYTIYYGPSPTAMTQTIQIADPKVTAYIVQHMQPGTYYFSVSTSTAFGTSARTLPVPTTIH